SMAGGVQHHDGDVTQLKRLPVCSYCSFKTRLRGGAIYYLCSCFLSQVQVTRYEVGMKMRFEYIFDLRIVLFCLLYIGLYFAQRIYYGSFAVALYIISALCKASGINLFDLHN